MGRKVTLPVGQNSENLNLIQEW